MKNHEFTITDINVFAEAARKEAANCLSVSSGVKTKHNADLFDDFLTINQCCQIIKDVCKISDDNDASFGKLIINEDTYVDIVLEMADQLYQSSLCKLASQNLIECAWDDKNGKMEFWILDDKGDEHSINNTVL